MKRYIRTTATLSDLISKIRYFVIVDDCTECNLSEINASDDIDDDIEYLLSLPDSRLKSLPIDRLHEITDVGVLARLIKLREHDLTADQIASVEREYKKQLELSDETKQELLELFKQCNKVVVETRKKNLDFIAEYDLSKDDILSILHSLKLSDFKYGTRSINHGHLGDNLIVLKPKILIPHTDIIVGVNLYVKLDIDESTDSAVAFISIHPEDENKHRRRKP